MDLHFHPSPRGMEFANFPLMITDLDPDPSVQLDLIGQDFLDRLERIREELPEARKLAAQFNILERHLPHRFLHLIDLSELSDEHDYIRLCKALSEEEILKAFAQGIQQALQLEDRPDLSRDNISRLLPVIESLGSDDQEKWKILSLINAPLEKFTQYLNLLEQLIEPFERYYQEVEPAITAYKQSFDQAGTKRIDKLLHRTFRNMTIDRPVTVYFLGLYHYLIAVHQIPGQIIINLGIGLEDYFNQLEQSKERMRDARVNAFRSLGDKTRYEILRLIATGENSNKVLAQKLNVTSPNISYHIKTLLNENLIMIEVQDNKSKLVINKEVFKQHLSELGNDLLID